MPHQQVTVPIVNITDEFHTQQVNPYQEFSGHTGIFKTAGGKQVVIFPTDVSVECAGFQFTLLDNFSMTSLTQVNDQDLRARLSYIKSNAGAVDENNDLAFTAECYITRGATVFDMTNIVSAALAACKESQDDGYSEIVIDFGAAARNATVGGVPTPYYPQKGDEIFWFVFTGENVGTATMLLFVDRFVFEYASRERAGERVMDRVGRRTSRAA